MLSTRARSTGRCWRNKRHSLPALLYLSTNTRSCQERGHHNETRKVKDESGKSPRRVRVEKTA